MRAKLDAMRREFEALKDRIFAGDSVDLEHVSAFTRDETDDDLHAGYLCPWHTCQGTRH